MFDWDRVQQCTSDWEPFGECSLKFIRPYQRGSLSLLTEVGGEGGNTDWGKGSLAIVQCSVRYCTFSLIPRNCPNACIQICRDEVLGMPLITPILIYICTNLKFLECVSLPQRSLVGHLSQHHAHCFKRSSPLPPCLREALRLKMCFLGQNFCPVFQ